MDSRLLYDSAGRSLPSLTEQFRSLSPGVSLIFPWVVMGTRIERLLSPSSWWDGLCACLSSPTIRSHRGRHGAGPSGQHGAGWLAHHWKHAAFGVVSAFAQCRLVFPSGGWTGATGDRAGPFRGSW